MENTILVYMKQITKINTLIAKALYSNYIYTRTPTVS